MKFLENIWNDIRRGENLDLYVTVIMSIFLVVSNILGLIPRDVFSPLTVAILALITTTILGNRHRLDRIVTVLKQKSDEKMMVNYSDELKGYFIQKMNKAETIFVIGVDVAQTIRLNYDIFESRLNNKKGVRVLLLNPDNDSALTMDAQRQRRTTTTDQKKFSIKHSLAILCELKRVTKGNLEVRLIDNLLPLAASLSMKENLPA